jgi:Kef-type K+ transport system membrane component KefB
MPPVRRGIAIGACCLCLLTCSATGVAAQELPAGGSAPAWQPWEPWAPGPTPPLASPEPDAAWEPLTGEVPPAGAPAANALPPPAPDPAIAPVIDDTPPPPAPAVEPRQRPALVIRTILGLAVLVALAYAAAHPAVARLEHRLRITQVVTAGLPFILLGMAARHPSVGVLSDHVLGQIAPVLRIALGWIGFVVGFRFDARRLAGIDERSIASAALLATMPFAAVVAAVSVVLVGGGGGIREAFRDPVFLRDALVLGTAASMTAATVPRLLPKGTPEPCVVSTSAIVRLEELAGIAGLALVAAYFRPHGEGVTWHLPGTAWLMMTVGAGTLLGLLVIGMLQRVNEGPEFAVLALGTVSFAAGFAGYLHLSSVVVCFVAALLVANFPGRHKERFREALDGLERPIYLILLVVLGALWPTRSVIGWLLIPTFVAARLAGRWAATRMARRIGALDDDGLQRRVLTVAPLGSLAVAIVVNAQMLYPGGSIKDAMVAVVGAALVTEGLLQVLLPRAEREGGSP